MQLEIENEGLKTELRNVDSEKQELLIKCDAQLEDIELLQVELDLYSSKIEELTAEMAAKDIEILNNTKK